MGFGATVHGEEVVEAKRQRRGDGHSKLQRNDVLTLSQHHIGYGHSQAQSRQSVMIRAMQASTCVALLSDIAATLPYARYASFRVRSPAKSVYQAPSHHNYSILPMCWTVVMFLYSETCV